MSGMIECVAVRMFWKAEHLDPSKTEPFGESEWYGDAFPASMPEREREFWRLLTRDVFVTIRAPSPEMVRVGGLKMISAVSLWDYQAVAGVWETMIDEALK